MNESTPTNKYFLEQAEREAIEYVQNLKAFHLNWMSFLVVMPFLYLLNVKLTPGFLWVLIVGGCWLMAIVLHAVVIFGLFSVFGGAWEQREFRKRMDRRAQSRGN